MSLLQDAHSYLQAEAYSVTERSRGLLVGTREAVGGRENIYVWVPVTPRRIPVQTLMADFGAAEKEQPQARKFLLVETMEGIPTDFRSAALRYFGVQVNTPARFFDTTFRDEDARATATNTRQLRDRGHERLRLRTAQPYVDRTAEQEGDDLLPILVRRLRDRGRASRPIHLVIGPAGIGKSYLFESLFSHLYDLFQDDKRSLTPARRPLALMPEYLPFATDATVNAILDAFLSTEFTRPLNKDNFAWKLLHGYGAWLIDGLDEIIARDTGLFDWLLDLMTRPDAPASPVVLICLRDSVFSTNAEFREFVADLEAYVTIYELSPWHEAQQQAFAQRRLTGDSEAFLETLRKKPGLSELARLPYYCSLLIDQYRAGTDIEASSDVQLLELALNGIVEREESKGFIDSRFVSSDDVRALLEGVAAENMSRQFVGVDLATVDEWAQLIVPDDVPTEDRQRLIANLAQLALFSGGEMGRLYFAQELLEHYLLGCYLVDVLDRDRSIFASRLRAAQIPWDWLTMRVIADHVRAEGRVGEMVALAYENLQDAICLKNLLQIAASASQDPQTFQKMGFPLESLDLSGVRLEGLDLSGLSLRGCNLSDTEFITCELTGAALEGAVIRNTRFAGGTEAALSGAEVGDLSSFYSLRTGDGKLIADFAEAQSWFARRTARPVRSVEPCAAAQQLRHMLGKYVYPTGEARRSWLDEHAIVSGKRYIDQIQALADALVRHGYIVINRGRYDRPGGDNYADIVKYVRRMALSSGLRHVLNDICDRDGCVHVPRAA